MLKNIKGKINSDSGAMGTVETVVLIAISIFALLALYNYVIVPFSRSAEGMGETIKTMNPKGS